MTSPALKNAHSEPYLDVEPNGTVSLRDLHNFSDNESDAAGLVKSAFERGLQMKNPTWTAATLESTLTEAYAPTLREKLRTGCFPPNPGLWVALIEDAFILGQLTGHFALRLQGTIPGRRHFIKARHVFARAVSSKESAHWVLNVRAYELPAEALRTVAQIDQECPLCG